MSTLAHDIERYRTPLLLSTVLPRRMMTRLRTSLFILTLAGGTGATVSTVFFSGQYFIPLCGFTLVSFSLWCEQILLYSYHNSYFFHGLNSILGLKGKTNTGATYEAAQAVLAFPDDLTAAFVRSSLGEEILVRANISLQAASAHLDRSDRPRLSAKMIVHPENEIFSLISLGSHVVKHDPGFRQLLADSAVPEHTFHSALRWVVIGHHRSKQRSRWWGRDMLSKNPPLGSDLAYGTTYLLSRFTRDIRSSTVFSTIASTNTFSDEIVGEVETALSRLSAANVLLLGDSGVGKMDLLVYVQKRLDQGKSLGSITGYNLHVLDTARLFTTSPDKHTFTNTFLSVLTEAANAGNVVIIIEGISVFIKEAEALGVFIPELLDPYLASPSLHIIATDTPGAFHATLETRGGFTRRFAEITLEATSHEGTLRVLESVAVVNESVYNVLFTYPALEAIALGADRYIVEGVMPGKAVELLIDIAGKAAHSNQPLITADFVYSTLGERTGIPAGPIDAKERDRLLNLETILHERVIGQDAALQAVARTMRRARAGVQTSERPIGSFLFLGPTGVGKTETAKALAHVFFGNEQNMHRFDMTEYSEAGSLARLIGSAESSGGLCDALREKPYAVVLLDEFEKAHKTVHDLMLQILDEGRFTDARGEVVNARNTIVVATSNAGSDLIMRTVAQRGELATLEAEIIDHIINSGLFRPELINRFDSTVIFEPLNKGAQTEVAQLFLRELADRMKEKGYTLAITSDLIDVVVKEGYHPQFGARPMRRAVQDVVEEAIATRIIAGTTKPGDTITLTKADFA
ncbi:AAA family ATPase [Patescibacteria group bacterium]|nr:AAA family ATPase [Patescibacteria group bacterium]